MPSRSALPPDGCLRAPAELAFVPLAAEHFLAIEPQDSQRTQYGIAWEEMDWSTAKAMAAQDNCWTALRGETPLAIFGINETFPERQGVAFAIFGQDIGRAHHRLTRFAREEVIGKSALPRLEAIVRCADVDHETGSQFVMMTAALQDPTPQVRWAIDVGFSPTAVLRKFGAAGETHMLLERIR